MKPWRSKYFFFFLLSTFWYNIPQNSIVQPGSIWPPVRLWNITMKPSHEAKGKTCREGQKEVMIGKSLRPVLKQTPERQFHVLGSLMCTSTVQSPGLIKSGYELLISLMIIQFAFSCRKENKIVTYLSFNKNELLFYS